MYKVWDLKVQGGVSSLRGQHAVVYRQLSSELKYYLSVEGDKREVSRELGKVVGCKT